MKSKTDIPPQKRFLNRRPRGVDRPKCRCGKDPFYSVEAAEDALRRYQAEGQLNERRREIRHYQCEHAPVPTWHLTSETVAQYRKRVRVAILAAVKQAGGTSSYRSVPLDSPRLTDAEASNPYAGTIIIEVKG